ncbi:MAG: type II restriction endonuclease [Phycisphaerae bacterium]
MRSRECEDAINDALRQGNALLKCVSANDVGETHGHQCGFYLPKAMWRSFTPHAPTKGKNSKHPLKITWPDGRVTDSVVTGYFTGTRSEYRLTRFGRDFPWLSHDMVGDLLVLIRNAPGEFTAHVLRSEEDIEDIQAALGVAVNDSWAAFPPDDRPSAETPEQCVQRRFRLLLEGIYEFPDTATLSSETRDALGACLPKFDRAPLDDQLVKLVETEYELFRLVENKICTETISRKFHSVEEFLKAAASLMNRRKARAGRSLENHFAAILRRANIRFDQRARVDGTSEPDILIPGKSAYNDLSYPAEKLCLVGLKTTCKDRWRQVLNEGRRVRRKHILTLQKGISENQLNEMYDAGIILVVPEPYLHLYPRQSPGGILTVEKFVGAVKTMLAQQ